MIPTIEQLEQKARELALIHHPGKAVFRSSAPMWHAFRRNLDVLRDFATELKQDGAPCFQPAEQWLIDHADLVESEAFTVQSELTRRFSSQLPRLKTGAEPRVLAMCSEYVKLVDGLLEADAFARFSNAYQEVTVLSIAEVWSMPLMLRIAVIGKLAEVMEEVRERRRACLEVDKLLVPFTEGNTKPDAGKIKDALENAGLQMPLSAPVIVHLVSHLNEWAEEAGEVRSWLLCKLDNGVESLSRIILYEHQLQASYELTAGHLIQSLRTLSRTRWDSLFERMSVVERTLSEEHAGTYPLMDGKSRATLRGQVERLSRSSGMPENVIAQQAIALASKYYNEDTYLTDVAGSEGAAAQTDVLPPRQAYAAYYLLDRKGNRKLLDSARECTEPKRYLRPIQLGPRIGMYLGTMAVIFAAFLFVSLWSAAAVNDTAIRIGAWTAAALVLVIPVSEWTVTVIHGLIGKLSVTQPLLRYDYASGIDEDAATITVIPVIWSKPEEAEEMADRLELHYLANLDPHMGFALLGDFADAATEHAEADERITEAARRRIEALNRLYGNPDTGTGPFYLFQRGRKWNESEQVWMGWERKRGKLVEFVELLSGRSDTSCVCIVGDCSAITRYKYVITLDADTELPVGVAARMIGTMHLPYNRARLNAGGTRVLEGYGVLQPRVGISYESVSSSRLARLWSGKPGIDPYSFAMSDPYQDAFGQGIFTGKGIFDIAAFKQVLNDRIPENSVLSHDLLEGGFLRGGLLSDIEVVDGHPVTFQAYQQRLHRWVRGDWQLLCWIASRKHDRCGNLQPIDLSLLTRWQIIDNMRRSLVHPAVFILLAVSMFISGAAGAVLMAAGLVTLGLPLIRALLALRRFNRKPALVLTAFLQSLVQLIALPYQSVVLADAIARTLYRLAVSKRNLLEWTSSAEVERRSRSASASAISGIWSGHALSVLFGAAALMYATGTLRAFGLAIAVLWLLAPFAVRWLNGPPSIPNIAPSESEANELRQLAAQMWAYYEDFAGENDNWLPPDNVQMEPPNGIAHRTSPTNIGLLLACTVAARDFGFIDTRGMLDRVGRTIGTIEKMEKRFGHLYNWYDTQTLRPLPPLYVSTVDSGNFVAYLIALKQGILEWAKKDGANGDGSELLHWAEALAGRIESIVAGTDFRPLYDDRAELFTLGYHAALDRREDILYDLLASEARQASFLAIAFGQAPVSHWFRLGRAMAKSGKHPTLLSWSGTMFEYLMPSLLMRTYRHSVWDATYRGVVKRQIEYARQRGVPFGISESGYFAFDYQMNYQYRAFGVPGLGFQRGLENDLVLAPYAAIMALPIQLGDSLASLKRMEEMGAKGKYGYYEAIDCTAQRMPEDTGYIIVRSFMAHHIGMSFLTLGNLLLPRTMIDRFHADKRMQAAELLLQERIPERPAIIKNAAKPMLERTKEPLTGTRVPLREFTKPREVPEVCVLSNGSFTSVISDTGGGFTRYGGMAVSRWHEDPIAETPGSCIYIRDVSTNAVWSPAFEPCRVLAEEQKAQFALDKASFTRRNGFISSMLEICVPPDQNAELRRLSLTNTGEDARVVEVTTYLEIALAPPAADEAHPAFSKLFVQTEYDAAAECLLAVRRPRDMKERPKWAVHNLSIGCDALGSVEFETDRSCFIGRGHTLAYPASLECRLSGTVGAVLDPAFVMRRRISIGPGETVKLFTATGVADSREEALDVAANLCSEQQVERAFQLAWTHSRIDLRHQRLSAMEAAQYHTMAGRLLYQSPLREERAISIAANQTGQSSLWPMGISGDLPIALVRIQDKTQMPFALKALIGHSYLRQKGIAFDLVFLIEEAGGYYQEVQDALRRSAEQTVSGSSTPGGVYPVMADRLSQEQLHLLQSVARMTLRADGPSFKAQLSIRSASRKPAGLSGEANAVHRARELEKMNSKESESLPTIGGLPPQFRLRPERVAEAVSTLSEPADYAPESLEVYNGSGGFANEGREYVIAMRKGKFLPAPWSNVMANPNFGCLITELGTGYTWWRNSREFKLTPWSNDPVLDLPGEVCYIRDEATGDLWTGAPSPELGKDAFDATHGFGYTRFKRQTRGIKQSMTVYVSKEDPVKFVTLELENRSDDPRSLSVTYYCNWVLGVRKQMNAPYIISEWDAETHTLLARNAYQETFRDAVAFLQMHAEKEEGGADYDSSSVTYTTDRSAFIGRSGSLAFPEGMRQESLSNADGVFADSCGAIRLKLTIPPRSVRTVYILVGADANKEAVQKLIRRYATAESCEAALTDVTNYWNHTLNQIEVKTPNRELDLMLNGWLLYQALSCRMWARTAFYQAGGAYGFRDQLQDSLSLLHTLPELTRKQIVLHASHQFIEGDVQHWWHEETERGIRTRYSDDLLWLPYAVSRYITHTGDIGVLDETAPFLKSEMLLDDEHERYEATVVSEETASIYEHCIRSIERASSFGEHGIPLMGIGDWNDGMNSVGDEGKGESVWLGWFLCEVLRKFADVCQRKGDIERADLYRARRASIAEALNKHAWDGEWYRRARTDDGVWLGSVRNEECRIDAIAQSWSVISGAAPQERARQAMQSFDRELVDRDLSVARLLTPPFDRTDPSPGYIQGYPPGIRENGAQYTHGVIWSIVAWCELGEGDKAVELFHLLNPVTHAQSPSEVRKYAGEPYVMAADVYTRDPVKGRAGWTWYTGASGWMYQAGIEWILGLSREGSKLFVRPNVPKDWPSYSVKYRYGSSVYHITVQANGAAKDKDEGVTVDGRQAEQEPAVNEAGKSAGFYIQLVDDGQEHKVEAVFPLSGFKTSVGMA
ncbi:GH36-type glycosyl hydrolase domain-containing protein [Paenibacillus sp. Soil522]|uniref:GH36-type glycosyl hydrolase domain-containing protein n=1 Tax=Paenibacillus sp. Soil522 TaxID=1736388 RepID=UPI0006F53DA6|nr:glucoamylase family protein [Paenibacillus sp. Soil522]KRE47020.1 glycosyl transferase family 36 [Paenibacillus sp. Soil522]